MLVIPCRKLASLSELRMILLGLFLQQRSYSTTRAAVERALLRLMNFWPSPSKRRQKKWKKSIFSFRSESHHFAGSGQTRECTHSEHSFSGSGKSKMVVYWSMCVVKHPVLKNQAAWMFSSLRQLAEKRQTEKCSHLKKKSTEIEFSLFLRIRDEKFQFVSSDKFDNCCRSCRQC